MNYSVVILVLLILKFIFMYNLQKHKPGLVTWTIIKQEFIFLLNKFICIIDNYNKCLNL